MDVLAIELDERIWWTDQDLNLEPHRYERRALTKLSYQSITWYHTLELNQKLRAYETQAMKPHRVVYWLPRFDSNERP